MSEALAKAFVTPIDREDLDMLSRILDDVVDTIDEFDISTNVERND